MMEALDAASTLSMCNMESVCYREKFATKVLEIKKALSPVPPADPVCCPGGDHGACCRRCT